MAYDLVQCCSTFGRYLFSLLCDHREGPYGEGRAVLCVCGPTKGAAVGVHVAA